MSPRPLASSGFAPSVSGDHWISVLSLDGVRTTLAARAGAASASTAATDAANNLDPHVSTCLGCCPLIRAASLESLTRPRLP